MHGVASYPPPPPPPPPMQTIEDASQMPVTTHTHTPGEAPPLEAEDADKGEVGEGESGVKETML